MAQEHVRIDDPFRDTTAKPEQQIGAMDDVLPLGPNEVPVTDPSTQTVVVTFTNAAKAATADLTATSAIEVDAKKATVTAVTYTPAGAQAAPTAGNARTFSLVSSEGTVASYTFSSASSAFVSGTPVVFSIGVAGVSEETLTLASAHAGSGVADPGGVLSLTYTY